MAYINDLYSSFIIIPMLTDFFNGLINYWPQIFYSILNAVVTLKIRTRIKWERRRKCRRSRRRRRGGRQRGRRRRRKEEGSTATSKD